MGPLVLIVNTMIGDVGRWLVIQLILLLGFTSSLYALAGSWEVTPTGIFQDTCEVIAVADWQTESGGFGVWVYTIVLLVEMFLNQEAHLQCMRKYQQCVGSPHRTPHPLSHLHASHTPPSRARSLSQPDAASRRPIIRPALPSQPLHRLSTALA